MKRVVLMVGLCVLAAALTVGVLGSLRYGGPDGLFRRARAEIVRQRPPDAHVPTPLPTFADGPNVRPGTAVRASGAPPTTTAVPPQPSSTPQPSPSPVALAAPGPRAELTGMTHAWQTWNNCGPATLSMYLSYWGVTAGQEDIRLVVRPNPEDKHAGPDELADVARSLGLDAIVRVSGTAHRLKMLLANGIPVMVSTWHEDEPGDGMGHYRLLVGYDDEAREWIVYDSLAATAANRDAPYAPLRMGYDAFEPWWKVFNRRYVLVYTSGLSDTIRAILGEDAEDASMWSAALRRAEEEAAAMPEDAYAWFNLGSDLVALERHEEAAAAYDRARVLGLPWRMLWYQFGPFPAYYHSGRYEELVALADATLAVTTHLEELHYWRGMGLAAMGDVPGAADAFRIALERKPGYPEAAEALKALGG